MKQLRFPFPPSLAYNDRRAAACVAPQQSTGIYHWILAGILLQCQFSDKYFCMAMYGIYLPSDVVWSLRSRISLLTVFNDRPSSFAAAVLVNGGRILSASCFCLRRSAAIAISTASTIIACRSSTGITTRFCMAIALEDKPYSKDTS